MSKIGNNNIFQNSFNKINYLLSNVAYNIFYTSNKTQIKQIRQEFFNGQIHKAYEYLSDAREEHKSNKNARYDFLMLETEFLFYLNKYDEVKSNLDYIQTNLEAFLNQEFYQILSSILALDNKKVEFDKVAIILQKEFASKQPKEYFEIVFNLNSKQTQKAKDLYNQYTRSAHENKLHYIGGLIYANLYRELNNLEDYEKAKELYDYHLANNNPNFFEKLEIYKFFSIYSFNRLLFNHSNIEYKTALEQTKDLLNSISDSFHLFEKHSKKLLQNHYLHCLFVSDKQKFVNYYQILDEKEIDIINFGFYHLDLQESTNKEIVEKRILEKNEIELLVHYLGRLISTEPESIISFIDVNKSYLENEIVSNIYLEAKIHSEKNLEDEEFNILEINKDNSIVSYLSYLEAKKIKLLKVKSGELEELINKLTNNPLQEILVIKTMKLLSQNGLQQKYLEIALQYKDTFKNIISETLKICAADRNLLIADFNSFIEKINDNNYAIQIANIYLTYSKITKAYKYYKIAWEHFDFLENDKIEFAFYVLANCSIPYYFQNSDSINRQQDSIFKSFLEEKQELLTLEQTFILAYYIIVIEQSYDNGFFLINKKLLKININDLDKTELEFITPLYFYSIWNKIDIKTGIESNLLLKKDNTYYIIDNKYSIIDSSYLFTTIDQKSFNLMQYEDNIEKLSIYHFICNKFIYSLDSNKFIAIESTEEDPLGGIKEFMHQKAKDDKEVLMSYSDGENISFYNLAGSEYRHYFGLINILLNSNDIVFHSGRNNAQPFEVNKLLTLSSILFLNKLDKLDIILAREDIYIQQTTVNWLLNLIKELNSTDEMLTVFSDGSELYKNLADKQQIDEDKKYLLDLANKITSTNKVIDDTDSVFPIRESYQMLVPHIGEQEYRAIAFAYENNFQIISEDRIFEVMYGIFRFNLTMLSNSMSLLAKSIEPKDFIDVAKELDSKNYSYVFNEYIIQDTLKNLIFKEPIYFLRGSETKYPDSVFEIVLKIAHKYGWLEWLEKYYNDNYILKIPSVTTKPRTFITSNIEYIFDLVGIKIN